MKFKKRAKEDSGDTQWYFKIEDDGTSRIQCTEKYPEFIEWVAAGNTPEEAD
tara:strand:+ start:1140 stop:1295 length:156 start_codon:yes stop_codon:yes gene_type:complete